MRARAADSTQQPGRLPWSDGTLSLPWSDGTLDGATHRHRTATWMDAMPPLLPGQLVPAASCPQSAEPGDPSRSAGEPLPSPLRCHERRNRQHNFDYSRSEGTVLEFPTSTASRATRIIKKYLGRSALNLALPNGELRDNKRRQTSKKRRSL